MKRKTFKLYALAIFALLFLCLTLTSAFALYEEKTEKSNQKDILLQQKSTIEENNLNYLPENVLQENEQEPGYEPGVIIVKFKDETVPKINNKLSKATLELFPNQTGIPTIDSLNQKHKVTKISPVFEDRKKQRLASGMSVKELNEKTKAKFPIRSKRAPQGVEVPDLTNIYQLNIDKDADVIQACREYKADPNVEYCQPNYVMEAYFVPNDPYYNSSGSWGQPYDDLWGLKKIHTDSAWDITQGEGVVVAVVDTGLDYNHPDIAENVWVNPGEISYNGIDDDGNGYVDDVMGWDFAYGDNDPIDRYGHGTHVSGTIAAVGNNGLGVVGVAPKARIMAIKGLADNGSGYSSRLAQALVYAAENGADIINNSWGCSSSCPSNPAVEEAVRAAYGLGTVVVFAAGNSASDVADYSPQNMSNPKPIIVAATDQNDTPTFFTNKGVLIDVAAPGGGTRAVPPTFDPFRNILSLKAATCNTGMCNSNLFVGTQYLRQAGTSMAAPHVAGLAALVLAHAPAFSNEEVRQILRVSANDVSSPGFDELTGAGRINAQRAITIPSVLTAKITHPTPAQYVKGHLEIRGSVLGNLYQYRLEYRLQSQPTGWQRISVSSTPVKDEVLGIWDTSQVANGSYVLRLSADNTLGQTFEDYVVVSVDQWLKDGWPVSLEYWMTSPIIADIDGNGDQEIVVKTFDGRQILIFNHDGTRLAGWPETLTDFGTIEVSEPPVLIDLDCDGDLEILFSTYSRQVVALHHDGTVVDGWPVPYQGSTSGNVSLMADDLNDDGFPEVVWYLQDSIYIVDHKGQPLSGWPRTVVRRDFRSSLAMATGDLDQDGIKEIVVGAYNSVYVYRLDGTVLLGWPKVIGSSYVHFIVLGDADRDGQLEVFMTEWNDGHVYAFKSDGTNLSGWPVQVSGISLWSLALGDVDNDGFLEVFSGLQPLYGGGSYGDKAFGWRYTGTPLPGWPITLPVPAAESATGVTGISLADIDGNGTSEVLIKPGNRELYAYDATGQRLTGFPLQGVYQEVWHYHTDAPAIGDLDQDGSNEVITVFQGRSALPETSWIYVWDIPGLHNPHGMEWPMYGHDPQLTSLYTVPNRPPVLSFIGNHTVKEGEALDFTISASDLDKDSLTYSAKPLPLGASFTGQTFSWTPGFDQADSYKVTFSVSDGLATDLETVIITVNNVNRAPIISDIPNKVAYAKSLLTFKVSAIDPDGDSLTYSATNLPLESTFNPATQIFSWTPKNKDIGTYYIAFTVTDIYGASDSRTVQITVEKEKENIKPKPIPLPVQPPATDS